MGPTWLVNVGAYHRGIDVRAKRPNLDKLAFPGDDIHRLYAEASCTAGRVIHTGELPIRTGLTTVGQAGEDVECPDQGRDYRRRVLKSIGYGNRHSVAKNHLGDLNKYLPTVHGFRRLFGYLSPRCHVGS